MSVADNTNIIPTADDLCTLFSQLDTQQVEAFYKNYQQWQLEQQGIVLQEQIAAIEQQIVDNQVLMQLTQPSPIALATLTRLQSYGVDDVDLLDRMLERGDTWLDHALQLLEQCERLDVIHGNYTEWCQHALEDAYNWLDSMHNDEESQPVLEQATQTETSDDTTEALLIQRLMSEDENQQQISIPSILSYPTTIETHSTDSIQSQEDALVVSTLTHETSSKETQQKSPKHGLVSRILARVWHT